MGMWFAKWFGGRRQNEAEDDEPARFPMMQVSPPDPASKPAPVANSLPPNGKKKGFDPYNSGTFERRNAWERVNRR